MAGETMTTEPQAQPPERIWIEEVWINDAIQVHYNPTRKQPTPGFIEYVRADLPRAAADDRDRFLAHFMVKIEPFYEKKHGRVPPTQGSLWEFLAFVEHELEARATTPRATEGLTAEAAWQKAIDIVSALPVDNAVPNFTRAAAFKAEAVAALRKAAAE
jgi:hypothetical protein